MQNLPNQSLFRSFSANDWNQLEQRFLSHLFKIFSFLSLSTFYSNAEKMRKIESFRTITPLFSLGKTILSNGFTNHRRTRSHDESDQGIRRRKMRIYTAGVNTDSRAIRRLAVLVRFHWISSLRKRAILRQKPAGRLP
jgi:hypothetical protein